MFDFQDMLSRLFGGGNYQGDGVTTFPVPQSQPLSTGVGGTPPVGTPDTGLGFNVPTLGLALGGLQALNGLIQGRRAMNLAEDQFDFTRDITNTNLGNQIKSYNTALTDRLTSRAAAQGMSNDERDRLIAANSLSR